MEQLRNLLAQLRSSLDPVLADARTKYDRLSARERRLVTIGASAAGVFLLFLIVFSFTSSANGYRKRTRDKLAKLQEVQSLAVSYREAEQERQAAENQLTSNEVRLISYIEERATQAGLGVPSMNPKGFVGIGDGRIEESVVDLTLTDINLRQLVDFLRTVETGPGVVKVKSLRIEPRLASDALTAWTTVATYRMKP